MFVVTYISLSVTPANVVASNDIYISDNKNVFINNDLLAMSKKFITTNELVATTFRLGVSSYL